MISQATIHPFPFKDLTTENLQGKRFYVTPDGKRLPSVTTVISSYYSHIWADWRRRIGEEQAKKILAKASRRGTNLHKACEKYFLKEDMSKLMPDSIERFNTIKMFLDQVTDIYALENALYSTKLGIAGRTDCIGDFQGKLSVIDFKTSTKVKSIDEVENYMVQGTAYSLMYGEMTGVYPRQVVLIFATDSGEGFTLIGQPINYVKKLLDIIKAYHV